MNILLTVLIVILVIALIALVALYFFGRKLESKQLEQKDALEAAKQTISILVIDKKRVKIKDSGLPDIVYQQTPWYLRQKFKFLWPKTKLLNSSLSRQKPRWLSVASISQKSRVPEVGYLPLLQKRRDYYLDLKNSQKGSEKITFFTALF